MIKREMTTQKGNKVTITAEIDLHTIILRLYNNGNLVKETKEEPSQINEITTMDCKELAAKGVYGRLGNMYISKEMYDLAMEVYQEAKELQNQVTVTFVIEGWESKEVTIDTRENIEKQLQFIARKYRFELEVVKAAYEKATSQEVTQEVNQELENAKATIAKAEKQESIMTDAEYQRWAENYNNLYNEGEKDGYIPKLITVEKLERAKRIIKKYS